VKKYFEKLQSIGLEAIAELRKMDAQHADQLFEYQEGVRKGENTPLGYDNLKRSLENRRKQTNDSYTAKLEALEKEFAAAVDEYVMPSVGRMNKDDAEILKNFELSPAEFEHMAAKYRDNPTMGRLLEDYRLSHEGKQIGRGTDTTTWHTNWCYQTPEQRKAIFNSASCSVHHIIGQIDKYNPDRELNVQRRVSEGYHKLQGSDTEAMPAPASQEKKSIIEAARERGQWIL